jgi:hypothetical protein
LHDIHPYSIHRDQENSDKLFNYLDLLLKEEKQDWESRWYYAKPIIGTIYGKFAWWPDRFMDL